MHKKMEVDYSKLAGKDKKSSKKLSLEVLRKRNLMIKNKDDYLI